MANIFFQLSALMHIILTAIVYFTKSKEKTLENEVYRCLILWSIIAIILDAIAVVFGVKLNNNFVNEIVGKTYLCGIITWLVIYTYYIYLFTHPQSKSSNTKETTQTASTFIKNIKHIMFYDVIIVIIIVILPLHTKVENLSVYTYGATANFCYIIAGMCLFAWIILIIKNRNVIKKQHVSLIIVSILIAIGALLIQMSHPFILLFSSVAAFLTTLAYFMLENPDLHYIEELNLATYQAEAANNAKSDFLSSISHEIRTPLNAIVGFSQALAKEDISGSAKEEVQEILNASTNLLETVNGILDISKIEANKIEIINMDYSTKKMINELVSIANSRIGSKPIDFQVEIDEDLPPVLYGDCLRVKQIILNLLTNATKYTKKGYIKFQIKSHSNQDNCLLTIIVEDTGIGMNEDDIEMLFVKFQRFEMDKNTNIAGTGLGMAIIKGLVELMDGDINVYSEYGKGSTFTIVLEQKISTKKLEELPIEETTHRIEPFKITGKRVMVVDDNKINLKVAEKLLSEYELNVELVDSGWGCIDKIISGQKYDLILLDIMMPKINGAEVLKNLKSIVGFKTPVIALTADIIAGMEEKYISQGFDDCLPKPIVEEELFYMLKKYLQDPPKENQTNRNSYLTEVSSSKQKEEIEYQPQKKTELSRLVQKTQFHSTNESNKISTDLLNLIAKLKETKDNPREYVSVVAELKKISEKAHCKKLTTMAHEHELAAKSGYQEFIYDNYDILLTEIYKNIDNIDKNTNMNRGA